MKTFFAALCCLFVVAVSAMAINAYLVSPCVVPPSAPPKTVKQDRPIMNLEVRGNGKQVAAPALRLNDKVVPLTPLTPAEAAALGLPCKTPPKCPLAGPKIDPREHSVLAGPATCPTQRQVQKTCRQNRSSATRLGVSTFGKACFGSR